MCRRHTKCKIVLCLQPSRTIPTTGRLPTNASKCHEPNHHETVSRSATGHSNTNYALRREADRQPSVSRFGVLRLDGMFGRAAWLVHLTTQAQRPGPRDATIATVARWPGSLQRIVRPRHTPSSVTVTMTHSACASLRTDETARPCRSRNQNSARPNPVAKPRTRQAALRRCPDNVRRENDRAKRAGNRREQVRATRRDK